MSATQSYNFFCPGRKEDDPSHRLLFFPHAGGAGESYSSWFKELSPDIQCLYVRLPGRGCRFFEEAFDHLPDLIAEMLPEVVALADRPISFFGHSMGALIAFELAHSLRNKHGIEPDFLFLSGHRAPSLSHGRKRPLHLLDEGELYQSLVEMGGLDGEEVSLETLAPFLPTLCRDFKLCETYDYHPRAPLESQAMVLHGKDDIWIQPNRLHLWQNEFNKPIECLPFTGGHFYLNQCATSITKLMNSSILTRKKRRMAS